MARDRFLRLQIMVDEDELEAIQEWRFTTHMPSRSAAVRELLRRGLTSEGFKVANVGDASQEYGVVRTPASDLTRR